MSARLGTFLRESVTSLKTAGIASPGLDARLLIAFGLGCDQAELIRNPERLISGDQRVRLRGLIDRRRRHEPVSRIIGAREFHGRVFLLSDAVLDPRPDSEALIAAALSVLRSMQAPSPRILDLGTGSGALLITLLAEYPQATGIGVDISAAALGIAQDNARLLGVGDRCSFVAGDWASALAGSFDVIVANPPYIRHGDLAGLAPEVRDHDPVRALDGGYDGLDGHRAVIAAADRHLAGGSGVLVLEIGHDQRHEVSELCSDAGLTVNRELGPGRDLGGRDRVVIATSGREFGSRRKGLERSEGAGNVRMPSAFSEGRTIAKPEWGLRAGSWGDIRGTHDVSRIVFDRRVTSAG